MIPGINVNLGGTDYTVPPLNLRLFFQFEEQVGVLQNPAAHSIADYAKAASAVLLAVIQRNYPDLTADQFAEQVDFTSLAPMVSAMFGQSGFTGRPLEASPATPSRSPAPDSSASSIPPPDGGPTTSSNG
jgi:hypothetical protein